MRILHKIALVIVLVAITVGCCNCRSYQKKNRRPLEGTTWQLVQLEGANLSAQGEQFTLTLHAEEHRLSGMGACNHLMGEYTLGENRAITFSQIVSTRMACPEGDAEERKFIATIESTTHYDMDGPMLMLLSNGELRAILRALPQAE